MKRPYPMREIPHIDIVSGKIALNKLLTLLKKPE